MSLSPTSPPFKPITISLFLLFLQSSYSYANAALPIIPINNTTCQTTCGTIPVKYPFGTGYGCGHPAFSPYISCNRGTLLFSTRTGAYTISSIDYPSNTIMVNDPFMSNCSSMQNSGSFGIDGGSPFSLGKENIFVLLGCSTTSPVFDPKEDLCDTGSGTRVCRGLYSCKGVNDIGLPQHAPINTCCVYDYESNAGLGLDLPKLQCSSYASVYEFVDQGDPMKWKFGISLVYNDSYGSDDCRNCEDSGGLCGFQSLDKSFACICRNGVNTTTNCFGRGYAWSGTIALKVQTMLPIIGGIMLSLILSPF
ncbi:hypothetical protein PIB30_039253 [Stylosanthes scabra]|uniref:non-specific serine/threonine protein kinase n=1 Tax=Stylosanthes scabra TaxID=79078 RepID=A0ABU6UCY8_9FABA|nr:hypothetical protein [Stylosanthes scabra]